MSWQIRRSIGGKAFWTLLGSLLRTANAKTNWSKSKKKRKWSYKKYGVVLLACFSPPWKAARHANEIMDHITNTFFSFCAWVGLLNQRPVPQHPQAKLSPCSTWEHFLTHTQKRKWQFFLKGFFFLFLGNNCIVFSQNSTMSNCQKKIKETLTHSKVLKR